MDNLTAPAAHIAQAQSSSASATLATYAWFTPQSVALAIRNKPASQQQVELDGFVLASRDHDAYFEKALQQSGVSEPRTERANLNDGMRQQKAHRKACDVALKMGGDLDDILVMRRQRNEEAHFGVKIGEKRFFGKAQLNRDSAHWPERRWTLFASERGLALRTREVPDMPDVLLTEWHQQGAVSDDDVAQPAQRRALMWRIRDIHESCGDREGPEEPKEIGSSRGHVTGLESKNFDAPLNLSQVRARLNWIYSELKAIRPRETFVHGDVALPNTIEQNGQYFFLDWEGAGWNDPYKDPARLISYARWDHAGLSDYLEAYLGARPTPEQTRHFALVIAAFDIDHYSNQRLRRESTHPWVTVWAQRINEGMRELPDMPPVKWAS